MTKCKCKFEKCSVALYEGVLTQRHLVAVTKEATEVLLLGSVILVDSRLLFRAFPNVTRGYSQFEFDVLNFTT